MGERFYVVTVAGTTGVINNVAVNRLTADSDDLARGIAVKMFLSGYPNSPIQNISVVDITDEVRVWAAAHPEEDK